MSTDIKCVYFKHICTRFPGIRLDEPGNRSTCEHHEGFHNEYDDCCEFADAGPKRTDDGFIEISFQCRYVKRETIRFEKQVRSFWLDDNDLKIGRLTIPTERIRELSIDGRQIIGEEDKE